MESRPVRNFGRNIEFHPQRVFAPKSEEELLAILAQSQGRRIRVVGRLHSWSEAPLADDVMLDLRNFNQVHVESRDGKNWVTVGAGCQIKRLLAELDRQNAGTLPSLGLITEQSIAGAISTATHGSGKHSMSHYMQEIRVAHYDPETGEPTIRTINDGNELRAARCALGALGIIVSVSFWARPQYNVEEHFSKYDSLNEVLAGEEEYPLQQFYLMPWTWKFFAQHRRETTAPRGGWTTLYRWYFYLSFDICLHLIILFLARILRSPRITKFFLRHIAPRTVIKNWTVIDKSQEMLVMEHELFRHIEIEVFVTRTKLTAALDFVTALLKHSDGDSKAIEADARHQLEELGLSTQLDDLCGKYTHHYPICVRRVLPDDTLISMTSGAKESSYALSFISYARPSQRQGFFAFAKLLGKSLAALFDARPHWGKVSLLTSQEIEHLYPRLPCFREVVRTFDPDGRFRSDWLNRTLFPEDIACDP